MKEKFYIFKLILYKEIYFLLYLKGFHALIQKLWDNLPEL